DSDSSAWRNTSFCLSSSLIRRFIESTRASKYTNISWASRLSTTQAVWKAIPKPPFVWDMGKDERVSRARRSPKTVRPKVLCQQRQQNDLGSFREHIVPS